MVKRKDDKMNIYSIDAIHYAPRGRHEFTEEYLIAKSDKDVFDYMFSEYWEYKEWEQWEKDDVFDCCGEWEMEVFDLYYGAIQYGWSLVKENLTQSQVESLVETGVTKVIGEGGIVVWE